MDKVTSQILLRHHYLQKYGERIQQMTTDSQATVQAQVLDLIRAYVNNSSPNDMKALRNGTVSNKKVAKLFAAIERKLNFAKNGVILSLREELGALIESEYLFIRKILGAGETAPAVVASLQKPILGYTYRSGWSVKAYGDTQKIKAALIKALQDGIPVNDIFLGTKELGNNNGLFKKLNDGAASLAITQVNGAANNARANAYAAYKVKRVMVVATLDFRTTPICRVRDGTIYKLGEEITPPYHYRCRSLLVPYTGKGVTRPYVEDSRPVIKIPHSEKADKIGRTSATYEQWFNQLPDRHKLQIVGKGRLALLKAKSLSFSDLVNIRTGKVYTLAELDKLI